MGASTADGLTVIDRPALNWIGPLTEARFEPLQRSEGSIPSERLTVSAAAVRRGLGLAGGDVEEAVHKEGEVGLGGVLRPVIHSGEI